MEHKEATTILMKILNKRSLSAPEKQAILTAIGVLSWTSLAKSRMKRLKDKRDKDGRA